MQFVLCSRFIYLSKQQKQKESNPKSIILLSVVFAIISGVFASPTTPILASIISTAEHGQKEITKKQIYIFLILMVFATITYFVSYSMNSR
jgi:hypothetical protein